MHIGLSLEPLLQSDLSSSVPFSKDTLISYSYMDRLSAVVSSGTTAQHGASAAMMT
jgi:hypothetical protein